MRILVLFEYPTLNGGEHSFLAHAPRLQERGCELVAVAPPDGPLAGALQQLGMSIVPWRLHNEAGVRLSRTAVCDQLVQIVAQVSPDLVHGNSLSVSRILGAAADRIDVPCVGHVRDIVKLSAAASADLHRLSRLLCVSEATRQSRLQQGADPSRTFVVYNGVDTDRFAPGPSANSWRRELGIADDALLIGGVGQIGMRKGWDTLLEAARLLESCSANFCIAIVGERHSQKAEAVEYERRLHQLANELDRPVRFLGRQTQMPSLLQTFDLLAHPARQEPLGRVLLEAAASGLPILASDVGGTREIFPPAANAAVVIPPNDPPAWAAALTALLADREHRQQLGAAARRQMLEAFAHTTAADRLAEHYQAAVESADPSDAAPPQEDL